MAIHESRFPIEISYGSAGGPGFKTHVNELGSGQDERNSLWATPKHRFDVVYGIKSWEDMQTLRRFYLARHGVANGFRFFDWMDHTSAPNGTDAPAFDDQVIGIGDGTTTRFQLRKVYAEGNESRTRIITKPIHGETIEGSGFGASDLTFNVLVGVAGSSVASGWSVDVTTGEIVFSVAPGSGQAVTAGFGFDVPCYFGVELDAVLMMTAESFDNADVDTIPLVEFNEPTPVYEDVNLGGAYPHGEVTADFLLTMLQGRVHTMNDSTGVSAFLPDKATTPLGGPIFYIENEGTSNTSLRRSDGDGGGLVATLAPDILYEVVLGLDSGGARKWYIR